MRSFRLLLDSFGIQLPENAFDASIITEPLFRSLHPVPGCAQRLGSLPENTPFNTVQFLLQVSRTPFRIRQLSGQHTVLLSFPFVSVFIITYVFFFGFLRIYGIFHYLSPFFVVL